MFLISKINRVGREGKKRKGREMNFQCVKIGILIFLVPEEWAALKFMDLSFIATNNH